MRHFVRHPTDVPINIQVATLQAQSESDCCMTTVSQGGLSCEVVHRVKVGCKVDVAIPSVSPPYNGSGEVMWCRCKGDHFEIGICFTNKEEAFKSRMVQQLCQIEHYKNQIFEKEGRIIDGELAAREWIEKYAADF